MPGNYNIFLCVFCLHSKLVMRVIEMKAIFAEEDCSQPIALRSHPKMKLLE